MDNVGSDFDLNSLIEGDVDDDDFVSSRDNEGASTPVVQTYYAPLKVRTSHEIFPILTFLMKHVGVGGDGLVGGVEVYILQMSVINITARE